MIRYYHPKLSRQAESTPDPNGTVTRKVLSGLSLRQRGGGLVGNGILFACSFIIEIGLEFQDISCSAVLV
jgi:hypothetical protein